MFAREAVGAICRTVLEQQIRARQQTFEEFAEYAETFAREHNEPGTLSVRHLQRLVAGRRKDGSALGKVRPATGRLLERIFSMSIDELLSEPAELSNRRSAYPLRVAIAVVVRGPDVLLVRRRGDAAGGNSWQFPAGMVKPGVSGENVAVRETLGETDVHCVVRESLGSRLHPVTNVLCEYVLCDYVAGDARNVDVFENVEVAWIDKAEVVCVLPAGQVYRPVLDALELSSV